MQQTQGMANVLLQQKWDSICADAYKKKKKGDVKYQDRTNFGNPVLPIIKLVLALPPAPYLVDPLCLTESAVPGKIQNPATNAKLKKMTQEARQRDTDAAASATICVSCLENIINDREISFNCYNNNSSSFAPSIRTPVHLGQSWKKKHLPDHKATLNLSPETP